VAVPDEPPALAYIEKTLADSYRKEIDQEENVWRSLPFFAATLALQLAALFQIVDKLPAPGTLLGWLAITFLVAAGGLTLVSLSYLAASIYPRRFDYVAKEPALLEYARELIRDEQAPENLAQDDPFSALVTLKTEIARQYAQAADNNRQINKSRERLRSTAGLAALGSVLMTVFLVAAAYAHYLSIQNGKDHDHAAAQSVTVGPSVGGQGNDQAGQQVQPSGPGPAPDAGRH
jgi:hypothetical protein